MFIRLGIQDFKNHIKLKIAYKGLSHDKSNFRGYDCDGRTSMLSVSGREPQLGGLRKLIVQIFHEYVAYSHDE